MSEPLDKRQREMKERMAQQPAIEPGFLRRKDAAAYLAISTTTFIRRCEKHIPYYMFGSNRFFKKADLDAWAEGQRVEPVGQRTLKEALREIGDEALRKHSLKLLVHESIERAKAKNKRRA